MQIARAMDRYGLSDDELRHQAETIGETKTERKRFRHIIIKDRLAYQVARYCDCKSWHSSYFGTHTFYGPEADREFATWLLDSLEPSSVGKPSTTWQVVAMPMAPAPGMPEGFILGCIERINSQLAEMTRARQRDRKTGDGRSLAVVKMALVEAAFQASHIRLRSASSSWIGNGDNRAYTAGHAAGDGANFSRPIHSGNSTRLIGRQ